MNMGFRWSIFILVNVRFVVSAQVCVRILFSINRYLRGRFNSTYRVLVFYMTKSTVVAVVMPARKEPFSFMLHSAVSRISL